MDDIIFVSMEKESLNDMEMRREKEKGYGNECCCGSFDTKNAGI